MVFVEWWFVGRLSTGLLLVAAATTGFWLVRKKPTAVRHPIRLLSSAAATFGLLAVAFVWWAATGSQIYSAPVYSPNKQMAARMDDYLAGGFGGSYSSVELFTSHGLGSSVVFSGDRVETAVSSGRATLSSPMRGHLLPASALRA